ncbi:hypothetical protein TNCV_2807561 [Trichonephila clavipes]|nr:hypothetical protein TNCV_2807561 [Trichonephila clavipes]
MIAKWLRSRTRVRRYFCGFVTLSFRVTEDPPSRKADAIKIYGDSNSTPGGMWLFKEWNASSIIVLVI